MYFITLLNFLRLRFLLKRHNLYLYSVNLCLIVSALVRTELSFLAWWRLPVVEGFKTVKFVPITVTVCYIILSYWSESYYSITYIFSFDYESLTDLIAYFSLVGNPTLLHSFHSTLYFFTSSHLHPVNFTMLLEFWKQSHLNKIKCQAHLLGRLAIEIAVSRISMIWLFWLFHYMSFRFPYPIFCLIWLFWLFNFMSFRSPYPIFV